MFLKNNKSIKDNINIFFQNLKLTFEKHKIKILTPIVALNLLNATIEYTNVIDIYPKASLDYKYEIKTNNIKEFYSKHRWEENNNSLYSLVHKELLTNKDLVIGNKNKLIEYLNLTNKYTNVENFENDLNLLKQKNIITLDTEVRQILNLNKNDFYPLFQDGNYQKISDLNYVEGNLNSYHTYIKHLIYNDITISFLSKETLDIMNKLSNLKSKLNSINTPDESVINELNKLKDETLKCFKQDINEFKINLENDINLETNKDIKDFYTKTLENVNIIEKNFISLFDKELNIQSINGRN